LHSFEVVIFNLKLYLKDKNCLIRQAHLFTTKTMANSDGQSDAVDWHRKISDRPAENKTGPDGNSNFRRHFQRKPFPTEIPTETHQILSVLVFPSDAARRSRGQCSPRF